MVEDVPSPRRVTIQWGPLTEGYAIHRGLLFGEAYAMHIDRKFHEIRLDRVVPVEGLTDVYTNDHQNGQGIIISNNTAGGERKLMQIYAVLTEMTAFELVTRVLLPQYIDFELFQNKPA
ncbi:hypothetical protein ACFSR7_23660 [Cohnella sp. GCM10020058]|uniref:hypothetical protein n=1 Tax=Cohnella sp. GCM10020058 TaxID=3317330 RepID=UPI003632AC4C